MRLRLRRPWTMGQTPDLTSEDRSLYGGIPLPEISFRDVHAYGGLALAFYGGWQLSPPWTCVAAGLILLAMGIFLQKGAR